jgi:uncharacterized protein (TIGR00251 family)
VSRTSAAWAGIGGVSLRVRVTPKAARETLGGVVDTAEGPALQVRVHAAPEDGEANAAVLALVAARFNLAKSAVALKSGHKSRVKTLWLEGDPESLLASLEFDCAGKA